ncbi:MAG TPA: hypothetical protein VGO07_00785 [Candidatus Saccharimonadales bacterium]|jgi:hypothetical protein|nr:hypothetical protein [Candidatus Saccharimonadales bacterium]
MTLRGVALAGNEYGPINGANVHNVPHSRGIALPGETGLLRPFAFTAMGRLAVMRAMAGGNEPVDVPVNEIPGFRYNGENQPGESLFSNYPVVSFRYYKADATGAAETHERVVALHGISYGVHPNHAGQAETWYVRGDHLGNRTYDETGTIASADYLPRGRVQEKHFSMACIAGPLGDPFTDELHRQFYAIPEISTITD